MSKEAAMPTPDHSKPSGNSKAHATNTITGKKNWDTAKSTVFMLKEPPVIELVNFESIQNITAPIGTPIANPTNLLNLPFALIAD